MQLVAEEVMKMPAGDVMDDLIQELVFGHQGACEDGTWYVIPAAPYSTEKKCAQQVIGQLPTRDNETFLVSKKGDEWFAECNCQITNRQFRRRNVGTHIGRGDTMPLAVCRAALLVFTQPDGSRYID